MSKVVTEILIAIFALTLVISATDLSNMDMTGPHIDGTVAGGKEVAPIMPFTSHHYRSLQTRLDEGRDVEKVAGAERDVHDEQLNYDNEARSTAQVECLCFFFAVWVAPCVAIGCKLHSMKEPDVKYCSKDICCWRRNEEGKLEFRKSIKEEELPKRTKHFFKGQSMLEMEFDADGEIRDINGIPLSLIQMPAQQQGPQLSADQKYHDNSIETANYDLSRPSSLHKFE